jgi:hypothetical protein
VHMTERKPARHDMAAAPVTECCLYVQSVTKFRYER